MDELNVAPEGSAGATDHVSGVATHCVVLADGVMVSRLFSVTFCGVLIAATVTVPTRCATWIVNALLAPTSPLAAVAVNVNGP